MPDERSYKRLFQDAGWRFMSFAVPFITDAAIATLIFVALLGFGWLLGLGKVLGVVKPEQLEAFALAHFWSNYGVFIAIGLSFLLRVVKAIFRGD
jgi:hypothetical protein